MPERELPRVLKIAEQKAKDESLGRAWTAYGQSAKDYQRALKDVLPQEFEFATFLQERKVKQQSANVLDLMSGPEMLRDLPVDTGLAVGLGDNRDEFTRRNDEKKNISVRTGNILKSSTWKEISTWQESHGVSSFDMITCMPFGGMDLIPDDKRLHFVLVNKLWSRLSPENGVLITQTPYIGQEYLNWQHELSSARINGRIDRSGNLFVTKTKESSPIFPPLTLLDTKQFFTILQ